MQIVMICLLPALAFAVPGSSTPFQLEASNGRITSLRSVTDRFHTDYIAKEAALGEVRISYRKGAGVWQEGIPSNRQADLKGTGATWKVAQDLGIHSWFVPKGDQLIWQFRITNTGQDPIELGNVSTPLLMRTKFDKDSKSGVLKHSFVSGAGSFIFWMRPDSAGPYLTMTCLKGTSLEYWNRSRGGYQTYVHSAAEAPVIAARKGTWRLPHTSRTLYPGESATYGYAFQWAKDYQAVRDALAQNGKLDVQVAPGMTVPRDLFVDVALRSKEKIEGIDAEHPDETSIRLVSNRSGYRVYRVRFDRLGENRLAVRQPGGAKTYLEFFSCLPIETLIKKRAAFLAQSQVKDSSKWYDGLLAEWNMSSGVYATPDNYDQIKGWRIYEVTCDDPGLGKPAYLASKNAEYPNQDEVNALDRYIEHFVWGGLQQTTAEPYPYSIYGIPDWKTLRASTAEDKTKGISHLWRCYDYPHIILMYYSMYRVATLHPEIKTKLSPHDYLQRAYGTAKAMYTVPMALVGWSPYETGYYNEVVMPSLFADLRREGMTKEGDELEALWTRKVHTFIGGKVDLFASEYAFDSTGFESTEALAEYALNHKTKVGVSKLQAESFLNEQIAANIFCRGSIEPAYYYLGSDYRGGGGDGYVLSYMAPMGGSGVLHYALNYTKDPSYLRLGYQSILSSWALTNAGDADSSYGYWYPGKANDGGAGGGFEPAAYGETWLGQPHGRGSWYYSCETDLGYCGYLRAARTVVADDPIFGRFCFGGTLNGSHVIPKDGVRRRFSVRTKESSLNAEVTGTHFVEADLDERHKTIRLRIEPSSQAVLSLNRVSHVVIEGKSVAGVDGRYPLGGSDKERWIEITG